MKVKPRVEWSTHESGACETLIISLRIMVSKFFLLGASSHMFILYAYTRVTIAPNTSYVYSFTLNFSQTQTFARDKLTSFICLLIRVFKVLKVKWVFNHLVWTCPCWNNISWRKPLQFVYIKILYIILHIIDGRPSQVFDFNWSVKWNLHSAWNSGFMYVKTSFQLLGIPENN